MDVIQKFKKFFKMVTNNLPTLVDVGMFNAIHRKWILHWYKMVFIMIKT